MSKQKKLFDITKKFRHWGYRITGFFKYRLLVNSKHILLIGGQDTYLKSEIIKNFSDTWRIANIDYQPYEECQLNIQLDISKTLNEEKINEITENIKKFSKHYECILFLPETGNKIGNFQSEEIFDQFEEHQKKIVQPALLSAHMASQVLTTNGMLFLVGDQKSFDEPQPQMPSFSIAMNQINYLNVIMGEREEIDTDAISLGLLERDQSKDTEKFVDKNKKDQNQIQNENELQQAKDKDEAKQIAECIRVWAEGKQRPLSGAFIKWDSVNNTIYPKLF